MKRSLLLTLCTTVFCLTAAATNDTPMRKINQVDFSYVSIQDDFWQPRLESHKLVTLPVCIDQIENKTGRIRNFENAAKGSGKHSGIFFDDSDVYKALEGIAYSLTSHPDSALEAKADEWIDKFAAAQQPDGYLDTYYILTGLNNRWSDMDKHEMYCAGHLIEAAVAYYKATGKRKLLDVSIRLADYFMTVFGPGKRDWVPGHEEIELALVKLYQTTGQKKYLDFAYWLLEERGRGLSHIANGKKWVTADYQDSIPVRDLASISGHAVRAMYLFCGMADVAAYRHDNGYMQALYRLWEDVVMRNMYITGGIGSSHTNEGFTDDYSLPNLEAYCETCASVGMVFWNQRMNEMTGNAKYIDVLERALYNGALAGISLKGDRFFYVNPLESKGDHHRQAWFGCACCPSQISRFLPSIGSYIYGTSDDAIFVNLFIGSKATFKFKGQEVSLEQITDYPWNGRVRLSYNSDFPLKSAINIRIPGWCKGYTISVNGEEVKSSAKLGYVTINRKWEKDDVVMINFTMPVEMVAADSRVKQDVGKRAIQRGPLVYCMEETDNRTDFAGSTISANTTFTTKYDSKLLGGITSIETTGSKPIKLIPYYSWDNREAGQMKVWLDYSSEK